MNLNIEAPGYTNPIAPCVLSIVVPVYNEEEVLPIFHSRLGAALGNIEGGWEVVYINDGSTDGTLSILKQLQLTDSAVGFAALSRNFGKEAAMSAGLRLARGNAVILIDADLQDPPEVVHEMIAKWRDGYDVVYGTRTERPGESAFKLATARAFYRLLNRLSDVPIPLDTGDFRLMSRRVVDTLRAMPERDRFVRGMVSWVGFRQTPLPYRRAQRFAGESKYPLRKMLRFATDGILSFSIKPLQLSISLGLLAASLSMLGIGYALFLRVFTSIWVEGWTALMIAVLFIGGVQLICVGILGEYVGRIYNEVKQRPLYVVQERVGFSTEEPSPSPAAVAPNR